MSVDEIEAMLNRRSGVLGLGGDTDFRELHKEIELGDPSAELAYKVYIHRLRKYIGMSPDAEATFHRAIVHAW